MTSDRDFPILYHSSLNSVWILNSTNEYSQMQRMGARQGLAPVSKILI